MKAYEVLFARSARREIEKLDDELSARIYSKIEALAFEPRPHGVKRLRGTTKSLWRLRVGDYRVVYEIDDEHRIVDISAVRHRREAYR